MAASYDAERDDYQAGAIAWRAMSSDARQKVRAGLWEPAVWNEVGVEGRGIDEEDSDDELDTELQEMSERALREQKDQWRRDQFRWQRTLQLGSRAFGDDRDAPRVNTLYKRVADKVKPVNAVLPDGSVPGGLDNWREVIMAEQAKVPLKEPPSELDELFEPRRAPFPRGTRLTQARLDAMDIGLWLSNQERLLAEELLFRREDAFSWEFSEIGRVRPEVAPPQEIRTVPHEPWNSNPFGCPRALIPVATKMFQERFHVGTIEPSHASYRNPWFLVEKKQKKTFRLILPCNKMNAVTIRDANVPPMADEFSERFAGCLIITVADFFSGYDQIVLHENSRDMTSFPTPLGLFRMKTLTQGATNSIAQFCRISRTILRHVIGHTDAYVDDAVTGGPKTDYGGEESRPGVRRFVLEHLQQVDAALADIARAGATVSGAKFEFCKERVTVVGYQLSSDGRHPSDKKVAAILQWQEPKSVKNARAFLGVCVYYRLWIRDFAIIAKPIYGLFKQGVRFEWTEECRKSMDLLKEALTTAPGLITIDYTTERQIYLVVDASGEGWGAVLEQEGEDGIRHPARYESGIWSKAERKYDALKLECRGLLYAMKKFRMWLYGVHFTVETDAQTLTYQLNRTTTDLPGALVVRWIAYIRLFDFEVRHIPGKKNTAADGLSRMYNDLGTDEVPSQPETDIELWVDRQLSAIVLSGQSDECEGSARSEQDEPSRKGPSRNVVPSSGDDSSWSFSGSEGENAGREGGQAIVDTDLSLEHRQYAEWLATLTTPEELGPAARKAFKQRAMRFILIQGRLYKRGDLTHPHRRVIDDPVERRRIIRRCHDEFGHRGVEGTTKLVYLRYYWERLGLEVRHHVKLCVPCQKSDRNREYEPKLTISPPRVFGAVWAIDSQQIGGMWLVQAREMLSGWPEAKLMKRLTAKGVKKFISTDVLARFGLMQRYHVDNGTEHKGVFEEAMLAFRIRAVTISAYNSQAQGFVEHGNQTLARSIRRIFDGGRGPNLDECLRIALWADRTVTKSATGLTPAFVVYGQEPVLPVEADMAAYPTISWSKRISTEDLLVMRAKQFVRRDEDVLEGRARMQRRRREANERVDEQHIRRLRREPLSIGTLVLLDNVTKRKGFGRKLNFQWLGPYRVREVLHGRRSYLLEELDGTEMKGSFHGDRLRIFDRGDEGLGIGDPDGHLEPDAAPNELESVVEEANRQMRRSQRLAREVVEGRAGFESSDDSVDDPRTRLRPRGPVHDKGSALPMLETTMASSGDQSSSDGIEIRIEMPANFRREDYNIMSDDDYEVSVAELPVWSYFRHHDPEE
jgi:hypothetical protein